MKLSSNSLTVILIILLIVNILINIKAPIAYSEYQASDTYKLTLALNKIASAIEKNAESLKEISRAISNITIEATNETETTKK